MITSKMLLFAPLAILPAVIANILPRQANGTLDSCPGYKASNVKTSGTGLTASLTLAGTACNVYGTDLDELDLIVEYQTGESRLSDHNIIPQTLTSHADQRLHVKIQDPANEVYQVPDSVFERPSGEGSSSNASELQFKYQEDPFSFSVVRRSSGEVLFDTSAAPIVFENQYLRLRTSLPANPSLYGLGEHSDSL
jgi:alpha-glucosidase